MLPESLRTVFMGTPEFALPTLKGLIAAGVNVSASADDLLTDNLDLRTLVP